MSPTEFNDPFESLEDGEPYWPDYTGAALERLKAAATLAADMARWARDVSARQAAFLAEHGYTREEAKALPERAKRRLNRLWRERLQTEGPTP